MRFIYERKLAKKGYGLVAGVDEVGRGPLAGPIVAAAVIFPPNVQLPGLADSKQLSPRKRVEICAKIKTQALAIGVASVSHKEIDRLGINKANLLVMKRAVQKLKVKPDYLLIDGERNIIDLPIPQKSISGGDRKCASIAAASIVAKVARDRLMERLHKKFPYYDFLHNVGYGTRKHLNALKKYGPCAFHRFSFYPVSKFSKRDLTLINDV